MPGRHDYDGRFVGMGLHDLALQGTKVDLLKGVVAPIGLLLNVPHGVYKYRRSMRVVCRGLHGAQVRAS